LINNFYHIKLSHKIGFPKNEGVEFFEYILKNLDENQKIVYL